MGVLEVILNLVDNMTPGLEAASAAVGGLESVVDSASNAIDNIDPSQLNDVESAAAGAGLDLQQVGEAASMAGFDISNIDPTSVKETSDAAKDGSQSAEDMASGFDLVSGAVETLIGLKIADWIGDAISAAGSWSDSWDRLTVAMGHGVESSDAVESSWGSIISNVADNTGRGAAVIKEAFTQMEIMGVNSSDVLASSFAAVSGQAYETKSSVETIESAFNRVVRTGSLGARQLTTLGLSEQRVHEATGLSLDEVNEKMKTLDANGRAAYLAMILNASGAAKANEAYKVSQEHVIDAWNRSMSAIQRIIGMFVLPVIDPIITAATSALEEFADVLKGLDPTVKTIIGGVVLFGGALASAYMVISGATKVLSGLAPLLGVLGIEVGSVGGIFGTLAGILTGPVGWAILAIVAAVTASIFVWQTWSKEIIAFKDAISSGDWGSAAGMIVNAFSYVGGAIYDSLVYAGQQIWTFFANLPAWIGSNVTSWLNMGRNFLMWVVQGLYSLSHMLTDVMSKMLTEMATDGSAEGAGTSAGQSTGKGIIDGLKQWLIDNAPLIAQTLVLIFQQLLPLIGQIIMQMGTIVAVWLYQEAIKAGQSFVNGILNWFNQLPGLILTSLMNTLMQVAYWIGFLIGYAIQAGSQFVLNFISWVSSLPGQLWGILMSALGAVQSFASQSPGEMANAGWGMVNGLASAISSLPGVVWNEIMNIYHTITNAGGQLYQAALDLGNQIVNGLKAGAGIASPGYMYYAIANELDLINKAILNNTLPSSSRVLGFEITDAFDPEIISGQTSLRSSNPSPKTNSVDGKLEITHVHDFINVPKHISTEELKSVLRSSRTDQGVIDAIIALITKGMVNEKQALGI